MEAASLIGSTLGDRYRLLEIIGDGGMGKVFRATQLATGQPVALKLLHPELSGVDEVVQRFEREAKVTTQLSHPHIVKVIEFGAWKGRLFLAMELLAGRSLAQLTERSDAASGVRLPLERTIAIMRPVLDALEYAHDLGVVHRDIKPENIMVTPGNGLLGGEDVKLLDFGIAKLGHHSTSTTQKLTKLGLVLGTPSYMSPEQAAGQEADVRSDLYSCGVILYQLLTGRRPFEADSNLDVLVMHMKAQPKSMQVVAADAHISSAVDGVVLRALAKPPAERFQSARELRHALEVAAAGDSRAPIVSGVDPTILAIPAPPPQARRPWRRVAIVMAAIALLVGVPLQLRSRNGPEVAPSDHGDSTPKAQVVPDTEAAPETREGPRTASPEPAPERPRTASPEPAPERPRTASLKPARERPHRTKHKAKRHGGKSKRGRGGRH